MGAPAGTFLPTSGFDPNAAFAQQQGTLANASFSASEGTGPSTMQAVSQGGVNLNAAETEFSDFLNNALINTQTANNKFGGGSSSGAGGTGGFTSGFTGA